MFIIIIIRGKGWSGLFVSLFFFHSILDTLLLLAAAAAASYWLVNQSSFFNFFLSSFMLFLLLLFFLVFLGDIYLGLLWFACFVKIEGEMQKKKKERVNFILLFSFYLFVILECLVLEKMAQRFAFFLLCWWIWGHEKGNQSLFVEEKTVDGEKRRRVWTKLLSLSFVVFVLICCVSFSLGLCWSEVWCQCSFRFDRFLWRIRSKNGR